MQVAVSVRRTVVVDHDIDTLNINTTTEDVSGNQYALLKCLERGVPADTKVGKGLNSGL